MPDPHLALRQLPFPAVASALGLDLAKFQRKGKDWAGPCPIHNSKNNVGCFRYEVDGGRWHCFSCNAKGRGAIDLTIALKSVNFSSAVEFLGGVKSEPSQTQKTPINEVEASDGVPKPYTGSYEKFKVDCPWLQARIPDASVRERYGVFCYENPKRKSAYSGRVMLPVKDVDGVFVCQVAGVGQAGENILSGQAGIVGQEFALRLACGEKVENELDGQTCPADHWFAGQDPGIHDDAFRKRHEHILPCRRTSWFV